ncbi:hypothetical protein GM415_08465 [Pseudodesulfovibrio cashew]|uniref:Sugar phosphate isomerase/epimerase n=1 Tax=Pseudodesulfovibrio cashew TaxID=2678688 RepID=A0A6I6JG69_9BACT|nr:cobamide remodeling phosphodiesterase CbiR [Pseudodesulfovibrio cashew]QGY40159.1 hypothetical protein GM415_08465 [Pseudodesulfovibrio cashew]
MTGNSRKSPDGKRANSALGRHKTDTPVRKTRTDRFPFTVAAPSFVIPAGVAENSRHLAERYEEIGLLFFETESCLAYTGDDLPPDLAKLPVSWHVHMPLDLPWRDGLDAAWSKLAGLVAKASYLSPRCWVLHPPTEPDMLVPLAARFREAGIDPADVLLENVEESDLAALWPEAREGGYSTCLDLGHILAYGQHPVLELDGLWDTVRMLHVYAPGPGGKHLGLACLDPEGWTLLRAMLAAFKGDAVTLEVFDDRALALSVDLLAEHLNQWNGKK